MGAERPQRDEDLNRESRNDNESKPKEGDVKKDSSVEDLPLEKMTKSQLIGRLGEIQKDAEKNYDLYLRSQAELDNIKKRFQKEKEGLIKFANDSLIKQLLPVVDSLEKALGHSEEDASLGAIREGIELTMKELMNTLKNAGVEEIQSVGQPFDPNFHEAMFERDDDSVESGTVLDELQKGYLLNQRLLRPSLVSVSKRRN